MTRSVTNSAQLHNSVKKLKEYMICHRNSLHLINAEPSQVKFDYPNEFLTSIHGHYGSLHDMGPVIIRSLTFESNRRAYGPFGVEQGANFSFPMTGGKIVGFHGKSGWFLDAIGVYLKPYQKQKGSKTLVQTQNSLAMGTENTGYSIIQGKIGNSYDIVLAVKQTEDKSNNAWGSKLSRQVSGPQEYNEVETKEKVSSGLFVSVWVLDA